MALLGCHLGCTGANKPFDQPQHWLVLLLCDVWMRHGPGSHSTVAGAAALRTRLADKQFQDLYIVNTAETIT
jgi:hypothetical protein